MSRLIANALPLVPLKHFSASGFLVLTLLLAACGGGGSASGVDGSRLGSKSPYSEEPSSENGAESPENQDTTPNGNEDVAQDSPSDRPGSVTDNNEDDAQDSTSDRPDDAVTDSGDTTEDNGSEGTNGENTDNASDSDTVAPGEEEGDAIVDRGDEPDADSDDSSADEESGPLEEVVSEVNGIVRLEWNRPEYRENGDYLEGDDIGGYELRYKQVGEEEFQTVIVENGWDEEYDLGELVGSYQFTIAAFDSNGLYSDFVSLSAATGLTEAL